MNRSIVWTIAMKDIRAILSSSKIWIGYIVLPLLCGVVLPGIMILLILNMDLSSPKLAELETMLKHMPIGDIGGADDLRSRALYMIANYMLGPLFLLIPVINSMMTAVHSFVGEKERRTLESLLFAPIQVKDLFLGKVLASFVPAYSVTLVSFVLCGLVVDGLTFGTFGRLIFPSWNWLVLLLWLTPAFTMATILFSVLVSARTKGFQEAQQLAGVVVLPVVMLLVGQATGLLFLSGWVLWAAGAVLYAVDVVLLLSIARLNQRDVLFERQVH
ncbi:ABC transporter permease subunit [Paenibacillus chartarius]|uniref:ABC transporter permease subunit n=1 Tax=Paenibacillus chartarius TaxID=747481 RepID=A0ABV6DSR9_9BACL